MVNLSDFGGEKALAAVFAAGQAFTLRRRLLQRAAQRPAIIERGANANAHVQALGAGRLHGCLRVCTRCGCSNKQSSLHETTLKGDCELRVRKVRQQNISPPAHRQQWRCDIQRFTARPVLSDELGFEQAQHVRVLGAAMPAICAAPHARTPAREVTNRLSRS